MIPWFADCQSFDFKHYQVEDGLSNNSVISILQDHKGFLWFGTSDGLNRFDGYSFKVFRNIENDKTSLGSNSITYLFEDRNNTLWVGTVKGIFYYNPVKENFIKLPGSESKNIRFIHQSNNGNILYAEGSRLFRYNIAQQNKSVIDTYGQVPSSICSARNGELWIGTEDGSIGKYNSKTDKFNFFTLNAKNGTTIEKLYATDKYLLLGTSSGLYKFDFISNTFSGSVLNNDSNDKKIIVRDILAINNYHYWLATEDGLYVYDVDKNLYTNLRKNYINPYSLSDNAVYSLYRDKEGGVWLGTYFGGVNYLANQPLFFDKYFPGKSESSIQGNVIREITQDKYGNYWIGTADAGLNKFDMNKKVFSNIKGISSSNIHGILTDDNLLYVGTFEKGLYVLNIQDQKIIKRYKADSGAYQLKSNFINAVKKTKSGKIIVGTSKGVYHFDPFNEKFTGLNTELSDEFCSAITEDSKGRLWIGTHSKGVFYNYNGKWYKLKLMLHNRNLLEETRILYLKESFDKKLLIGTEAGLYAIENLTSVSAYNMSNGLPGNIVYTAVSDTLNNIWASTSKGLVRIDKNNSIKIYTKNDGLLNDQFNYQSVFTDDQFHLLFGSVKGLIRFNPYSIKVSDYTPPLYFTRLNISNNTVNADDPGSPLKESVLLTKDIQLNHKQSNFSIDFAALNFTAPNSVQYAYKIDGLDNTWNYIGNNRTVYFTNVAPDNYQLHIRSTNNSGTWISNEKILRITVMPPLWKSNIAYVIYTFIILLITYFIARAIYARNKIKQARKMERFELSKEKELTESKIDFFTNVAHEIRTPLTLIKAPVEKLMKNINDIPAFEKYVLAINKNTARLISLTNELLDFRKIESKHLTLNTERVDVRDLLLKILPSFQIAAEENYLEFSTEITESSVETFVDAEAFTKIISNLLNNAVKYAYATVMVRMLVVDNSISIYVYNDGKIVPVELHEKIFEPFFRSNNVKNIRGSGIGLAIANSLARLHEGSLEFFIHDNKYNTFHLKLPIK